MPSLSTNDRPFIPDSLRGLIRWKPLAAALGRSEQHIYRAVAVAIAVFVVLLAMQPDAARALLEYCRQQADAWRESEIRELLARKFGVPAEHLDRTQ